MALYKSPPHPKNDPTNPYRGGSEIFSHLLICALYPCAVGHANILYIVPNLLGGIRTLGKCQYLSNDLEES